MSNFVTVHLSLRHLNIDERRTSGQTTTTTRAYEIIKKSYKKNLKDTSSFLNCLSIHSLVRHANRYGAVNSIRFKRLNCCLPYSNTVLKLTMCF